ncbi:MAG: hypothetical protein PHW31_04410 [Candidatus Pacebacteria bacterium]|nr:hypothetical protein [Candidatus Paceibacterota bacterium]
MKNEIKTIENDLEFIKNIYLKLLSILPSFNITDSKVLPYGLKAHTRSVSWLVEQVITQQTKYNAKKLGIDEVNFDFPDASLHDCEIIIGGKSYFVNVKIHNIEGKENKNDIAAVEKLYFQYRANKNYILIYACFGIKFENIKVSFVKEYLEVFSPQFLPIYVNPRNDKIQATYRHNKIYRTREEFLKMLQEKSKSIILK